MLQLLSLAHGFAAPQPPFSGPFWNLASQATGPWDQYWWLFDWRDGGKSTCAPGHAKYQMAIVSRAEKDGAYGDDHSASIEIYKQAACTYWYLDNDQVLRWYAKGYDAPAAALTNVSAGTRFLAFDGWSQWKRDPTSTLTLSDGKRRFDLAGAGMSSGMGAEAWVYGTRCDQATRKVPTYMTVPDAPVDADVIVSRKNPSATVDDANHNCGVGSEAAFDSPNWHAHVHAHVRRLPRRPRGHRAARPARLARRPVRGVRRSDGGHGGARRLVRRRPDPVRGVRVARRRARRRR